MGQTGEITLSQSRIRVIKKYEDGKTKKQPKKKTGNSHPAPSGSRYHSALGQSQRSKASTQLEIIL